MTSEGGCDAEESDAEKVARLVDGCPSVARLTSGSGAGAEVATYLRGRRVVGVRLHANEVEVHIVASCGPSLPEVAEEVRLALRAVAGGRAVAVCIDEVELETSA